MMLNHFVGRGEGDRGVVLAIVSMSPVTHDVNDYVAPKRLSPFDGQPTDS